MQDFWSRAYPDQTGKPYEPIKTVRFQGSTASACGQASEAMGPFYCPNDKLVYLDTDFFDDMLTGQLGAKGGPFSIGYVIAHEYGHHVQDQLGVLRKVRTPAGREQRLRAPGADGRLPRRCLGEVGAGDPRRRAGSRSSPS